MTQLKGSVWLTLNKARWGDRKRRTLRYHDDLEIPLMVVNHTQNTLLWKGYVPFNGDEWLNTDTWTWTVPHTKFSHVVLLWSSSWNRGNRGNIKSRQRGPSRLRLCFLQPDLNLTEWVTLPNRVSTDALQHSKVTYQAFLGGIDWFDYWAFGLEYQVIWWSFDYFNYKTFTHKSNKTD